MNTSLAKNYAEALFSIGMDEDNYLSLQEEMKVLKQLVIENNDLVLLLNSSFISFEEKEKIIDNTLKVFNEDIINMLKIMVKNRRSKLLLEVIDSFNTLVNEKRGILEGLVYTIYPLKKEEISKIESKISEIEKVPCELKNVIDSNIIGGVKVVINGHIYDGSVKNKLESMRLSLNK